MVSGIFKYKIQYTGHLILMPKQRLYIARYWSVNRILTINQGHGDGVTMEELITVHLLNEAIRSEGKQFQINMAIEECGELISALMQQGRGRDTNVIEEIADVLIMTYQLRLMFGASEVDRIIIEKMKRLEKRVSITIDN